jgi:hypothetical protein
VNILDVFIADLSSVSLRILFHEAGQVIRKIYRLFAHSFIRGILKVNLFAVRPHSNIATQQHVIRTERDSRVTERSFALALISLSTEQVCLFRAPLRSVVQCWLWQLCVLDLVLL